jgi:hypothetical protein
MLHALISFGPEAMCEKVGIFCCVFIFECISHVLVANFCFFGLINFVALLSVLVCPVAVYRLVVLEELTY